MVSAPQGNQLMLPANFLTPVTVEPVGRWFLSHWERLNSHRTISLTGPETESESDSEESDSEIEFEDDIEYLRSLDPKDCKDQDHYRVLGLTTIRFRATDDQLKKAHRHKVLRHHPDKRRAAGEDIRDDDDYFTCITKAAEVLCNPDKRRAFDSVDPLFDDEVPEVKKSNANAADFYTLFGPVFKRNSRWSVRQPVPKLGESTDTREKVEKFYKFWYDFQSWREYSYLDEEDKEKGSDRDERRWIEKNNKIQRAEKKKEEMKRIRKLVDNAYAADPRIAQFREDEKQEKLAKKKAKQDAIKARRLEEERIKKEAEDKERMAKEKKEAEEKAKQEAAKKEKEIQKKKLKTERKTWRTLCKENNLYSSNEAEKISHMAEIDKVCEIFTAAELEVANAKLRENGREAFLEIVQSLNDRLERENIEMVEKSGKSAASEKSAGKNSNWTTDDLALLIKAVNLFPAGTNQRWDVVTSFINQHTTSNTTKNAKEVLSRAKELQGDFQNNVMKEETNKKAFENLEKQKKRDVKVESEASQRMETAAEVQGLNVAPWTPEEQQLLEQALKTFPSSLGAERWEKISSAIPNRSKKDCMKRYKELAELVRAKKAAQAAASVKK